MSGGTPYGATTIAGGKGERQPSCERAGELARFQGRHVAQIAAKLARAAHRRGGGWIAAVRQGRGEGILPGPLIYVWESVPSARRTPTHGKQRWGLRGGNAFSSPTFSLWQPGDAARVSRKLQDVHPGIRAVDNVNVAPIVDFGIVGLDRHLAALTAPPTQRLAVFSLMAGM